MKYWEKRWHHFAVASLSVIMATSLTGCLVIQPESGPPAQTPPAQDPPVESSSPAVAPVEDTPTVQPTSPAQPGEPAPVEWADIVEETRSGVALIDSIRCDMSGSGTGFLIDEDLVLTAAHVIEGSSQINLSLGDQLVPAVVLGSNAAADIALLKTLRPVDGHQFTFSQDEPRIGASIAALGFPLSYRLDNPLRARDGFKFTEGAISGLNQVVQNEPIDTNEAMQTDTALNSGNSGGPLIDKSGDIVAMAIAVLRDQGENQPTVEGTAYAVPARRLQVAVEQWTAAGNVQPLATCDSGEAPDDFILTPEIDSRHDQAVYVAQSLAAHGSAINLGNYDEAYTYFSPARQQRMQGTETWARDLGTSYWVYFNVYDIEGTGDELQANVEFWTIQSPEHAPAGTDQWCSIWDNQYQMQWNETAWTIDAVSLNSEPQACDAEMLIDRIGVDQAERLLDMMEQNSQG